MQSRGHVGVSLPHAVTTRPHDLHLQTPKDHPSPTKKRTYDGTIAWLQEDPQQWLHRGTHLLDVSLMQMDRCASSAEMGAAVVELRLGHNVWTKRGKTWSILMALP